VLFLNEGNQTLSCELTFNIGDDNILIMSKTITRSDLANAVHQQIGLSFNESAQLVSTVLEEVSLCLEKGEAVKLSSFGTFSVNQKNARVGRNPKTGIEATITPRRVLSFRPSNLMKKRVDGS
jgi:integration host factor subunit alpha